MDFGFLESSITPLLCSHLHFRHLRGMYPLEVSLCIKIEIVALAHKDFCDIRENAMLGFAGSLNLLFSIVDVSSVCWDCISFTQLVGQGTG